jgi:vacuolar-type H+-ATPase subunit E/Vma4
MSKELIRERILSDAANEARAIEQNAQERGAEIVAIAMKKAEIERRETETEAKEKFDSVQEKRAAAARLESSKIWLLEKRKVIDGIYALAKERLVTLEKEQAVALSEHLLTKYAEKGDEIVFAENYKYVVEVALLPIVEKLGLKISKERIKLDGGFILKGEKADKDLSYGALLTVDRDAHQAELAKEIFKTE